MNKLPISIGILSWKSDQTLRNTLNSYIKNGLFEIVNDITLFFQEVSDNDRKISHEYKIPFVGFEQNIGIGQAFLKLVELSRSENVLLLEHDWELVENAEITFNRLYAGIELLNSGYSVVRYRHRNNPGYPLFSKDAYEGNELNHYDAVTELTSPHLIECCHWIDNPDLTFPDKIEKKLDHYTTTSRWSTFTNNPCMYKRDFYLEIIYPFIMGKSIYSDTIWNKISLENDINHWWVRQNFKVASGKGLFTHNDIQKYGITQPAVYISEKKQNSISFIFAHRDTDTWTTPLSIVNEFKRIGWDTKIYSLFDSNDNYVDDNIHELLKTNPDIIMHMDWGQHKSPVLSQLKNTKAYCIMESGDDPQRYNDNSSKASWFDLILSPDIRCVQKYKEVGYNSEWWTHFSDVEVYFPMDIEQDYIAVYSRGMANDASIIDSLAQKYPDQIINQNGLYGKDHNRFLNSGQIVLQQSRYGEITRRIFEGMSCKKLVLADRLDISTGIQDLFVDGQDIVFYDDELDCLNKIVYYCNNIQEANKIAENGYNKVLNNHTQKQRVEFIIQKWKLHTEHGNY